MALAEAVEQIVAVKECSGDARRIPALLAAAPQLEILVGGDDWALEGFCAGATGWVTGVADVAPRECVALYEHCPRGELEPAREIYQRLLPLARFDMTPKLVQYFKAAMDEHGLAGGPVPPAAARAHRPGARRPGATRWPCCARGCLLEGGPLPRGGRLPHGGDADARRHGRRRADPGRHDARAQAALRDARWTTCGCC